jgi:DNA-binding NarL/FixJ family response regulator
VIRVLIADDDTLVRAGIRALLERAADISVVAEAAGSEEALAHLSAGVDVAVLDLRRPGRSSLDLLAKTAGWLDRPPCLLLTACDDRDALLACLRCGARGYLCKDVSIETLVGAICALAEGQTFFQPSLIESLRLGVRRHAAAGLAPAPAALEPLTVRETEVMRLIAAGYSNREIGGLLGMADGTVKVHVSRILSKLGVRDRIQAVLRALENGVI